MSGAAAPGPRVARIPSYWATMAVLAAAGLAAHWASGRLPQGAAIPLGAPPPLPALLAGAAPIAGAGLLVAYLFRALSVRRGWRETDTVRAILPSSGREKAVFALLAVVAGVSEEVVFRGFLPALLTPWTGSYMLAALPVNAAFGILHSYQGRHGMVRAGAMGLALAAGAAWTGSLWPSILAHAALNLLIGLALRRSLVYD